MTITTADARDLRNADAICFDHDSDGNGRFRAITRGDDREGERTISIPVDMSRVQNYGPGDGPWACFTMSMSAQHDDVVRTLVNLIRKDSQVSFVWTRDNSSFVTKEAGLVVDMLDVKVHNGRKNHTLRIGTYIGYDNSARMVKRS